MALIEAIKKLEESMEKADEYQISSNIG